MQSHVQERVFYEHFHINFVGKMYFNFQPLFFRFHFACCSVFQSPVPGRQGRAVLMNTAWMETLSVPLAPVPVGQATSLSKICVVRLKLSPGCMVKTIKVIT